MPRRLTCRVLALPWVLFSTAAAPSRPIFTRGQKPRPRRAPHPPRSVSRARLQPVACPWASVKAYCEQQVVIQSLLEPVESVSTKACVPTPCFLHLLSAVTPHVAPSLLTGALTLFRWLRVSTRLLLSLEPPHQPPAPPIVHCISRHAPANTPSLCPFAHAEPRCALGGGTRTCSLLLPMVHRCRARFPDLPAALTSPWPLPAR